MKSSSKITPIKALSEMIHQINLYCLSKIMIAIVFISSQKKEKITKEIKPKLNNIINLFLPHILKNKKMMALVVVI